MDYSAVALSKEDAHRAFIKYVVNKRYNKRPATQCIITNMEAFNTYKYRLETFTETRETKEDIFPCFGSPPKNTGEPIPGLWEIPVEVTPFFRRANQTITIPNTEFVQECKDCSGSGKSSCFFCGGRGENTCGVCDGTGYLAYPGRSCFSCSGRRSKRCIQCSGSGKDKCKTCSGIKKVIISQNLVLSWMNNIQEHTVERSSDLEMSELGNVPGEEVFSYTNLEVHPITNFPDPDVIATSNRLLTEHRNKFQQGSTRILQQRHTIEQLPVTKVTYEWKKKSHVFFVYGTDHQVSVKDYPATCGCSIM